MKQVHLRLKTREVMKENALVSNYTVAQYKISKSKSNEGEIPNLLNREFNDRDYLEVAVSEAVNKIMKTEFIYQETFKNLKELKLKLSEYIYWYKNLRIHGSLGYRTPVEYREERA